MIVYTNIQTLLLYKAHMHMQCSKRVCLCFCDSNNIIKDEIIPYALIIIFCQRNSMAEWTKMKCSETNFFSLWQILVNICNAYSEYEYSDDEQCTRKAVIRRLWFSFLFIFCFDFFVNMVMLHISLYIAQTYSFDFKFSLQWDFKSSLNFIYFLLLFCCFLLTFLMR